MVIKLTQTDLQAIQDGDDVHLLNKGAKYYQEENYAEAIEYYRLAASLNNARAMSNLGYCYMYGRSIEKNMDLAIAYFKIASKYDDIDATVKLGMIYKEGKDVEQDEELAIYYYQKANEIMYKKREELVPSEYPNLYFELGKGYMDGGYLKKDLFAAYAHLKTAQRGYAQFVANGDKFYEKRLVEVTLLLENPVFDAVRETYDGLLEDSEDEE